MTLSYDEVAEIIKLIDSSSCDELVLELGDLKLVVRRHSAGGQASAAPGTRSEPPAEAADAAAPAASVPAATAVRERPDGMIEVRAPMVGTFYRAPSPEAPPFVEPGTVVAEGDPLCLIEVMKLFTTVTAEAAGRVVEICAENAAMVEYGQALFVIEPA